MSAATIEAADVSEYRDESKRVLDRQVHSGHPIANPHRAFIENLRTTGIVIRRKRSYEARATT